MPFLEPYYREPYFPRSPIFFADFWGHVKFALMFLIFFLILAVLVWNVQPWFELKILPVQSVPQTSANGIQETLLPTELQGPLIPSQRKWLIHRVRRGETLIQIAAYYGVDPTELIIENRLYNPDRIFPGQIIYIPLRMESN